MIVLITPTGVRPKQFQLCCNWMRNQTYKGKVLWIVVDDGFPMTTDIKEKSFPSNWTIVKKYPRPIWSQGMNTQGRNIKAGIDIIKCLPKEKVEAIFIIEDDDYYKPIYLEQMMLRMKNYTIIGETNTIYYHAPGKCYEISHNRQHSSLFQTAFTVEAIPTMEKLYNEKYIDIRLFKESKNVLLFSANNLAIGIKGQAGRGGIGNGHKVRPSYTKDSQMLKLKELIGNDYKYYL